MLLDLLELMKNKMKLVILILYIFFINQVNANSDEFNFEGEEITILDEGNKLISKNGVKITTSDNLIFESDEFEYDKTKLELILSNNVIITDTEKNLIIKTNKIKYQKKIEKLFSDNTTEININNNYIIKSNNIVFDRSNDLLSSDEITSITDNQQNQLLANEFRFFIKDQLIKARNATIKDEFGNSTFLESFMGTLNDNKFYGKNVKINFNNNTFGNVDNNPRLYGNIISSNKNKSKISKGVFTTCKKMISAHLGNYLLKK